MGTRIWKWNCYHGGSSTPSMAALLLGREETLERPESKVAHPTATVLVDVRDHVMAGHLLQHVCLCGVKK